MPEAQASAPWPFSSERHQLFERGVRRVVVARVAVAGFLAAEDAVELLHRFVEVAGGRVDRGGDRDLRAGLLAVARRAPLWYGSSNVYFLFQRTPALVSSRMMPCSRSCCADLVGAGEVAGLLGGGALGDQRFHLRIGELAGLRGGLEHVENGIEAARETPAPPARCRRGTRRESMALLASRTYSKTAARASAVFRSSFRLSTNAVDAAAVRAGHGLGRAPSAKRSVSSRSLKLRRRSMAVAADFSPSNVKLSCLR